MKVWILRATNTNDPQAYVVRATTELRARNVAKRGAIGYGSPNADIWLSEDEATCDELRAPELDPEGVILTAIKAL